MRTTPSLRSLLFALTLVWLPSCGGPLFFIEADLPEVCKTFTDQSFPGVPGGDLSQTFPPQTFDFGDVLSQLPEGRLTGHLHVITGSITVKSGVNDLGFIDSLKLELQPSDASLPPLALIQYEKDPNAPAPTTIDLASGEQPDVFPYIVSGSITAQFSAAGTLPDQSWTADIQLCVSASAKYQYL